MAAAQGGVKVTGAVEFRKAMRRMSADLKDLNAIHKSAADMVADAARSRAPVLSGNLRASIKSGGDQTHGYVKAGNNKKKGKGKSTSASGSVPYAGPIHFGWPRHGIAPNPFIYDALDDRKAEVIEKYEAHIEALVEKVGRETPP